MLKDNVNTNTIRVIIIILYTQTHAHTYTHTYTHIHTHIHTLPRKKVSFCENSEFVEAIMSSNNICEIGTRSTQPRTFTVRVKTQC